MTSSRAKPVVAGYLVAGQPNAASFTWTDGFTAFIVPYLFRAPRGFRQILWGVVRFFGRLRHFSFSRSGVAIPRHPAAWSVAISVVMPKVATAAQRHPVARFVNKFRVLNPRLDMCHIEMAGSTASLACAIGKCQHGESKSPLELFVRWIRLGFDDIFLHRSIITEMGV